MSKIFPVLDDDNPMNPKFGDTGYEYSDSILNMGQIFIIALVFPLLAILFLAFRYLCCCTKLKDFFERQLSKTLFNRIIPFIEVSILAIATSSWINIY